MKRVSGGFTLMELMAATVVIGVTAGTATAFFGRATAAWKGTEVRLDRMALVEKTLEQLGEDLRNSIAAAGQLFEGSAKEISCAVADQAGELSRVRYRILPRDGRSTLIRETASFPEGESVQAKILIPHIGVFLLQYGYRDQEADGGIVWLDRWENPGQVPQWVRVRLESVSHEIWVPHGVVPVAPEEVSP